MLRPAAYRARVVLLLLALVLASCGRLSDTAAGSGEPAGEATGDTSITIPEINSEMLASPTLIPWPGGDPTWHIARDDLYRVLYADAVRPEDRHRDLGWPESCYSDAPDRDTDRELCLFPALRDLGISEDAMRFYAEEQLVVLATLGSGPVKVADMWWGPAGAQDVFTPVSILVPGGFMSATPGEWAPFATALAEAYASDTYREIVSVPGISDGYPQTFSEILPDRISAPTQTDSGWIVSVTPILRGGCNTCGIEFAGRFTIEFTDGGEPQAANFDGFCFMDWRPDRLPDFDWARVDALKAELAPCPPETVWP